MKTLVVLLTLTNALAMLLIRSLRAPSRNTSYRGLSTRMNHVQESQKVIFKPVTNFIISVPSPALNRQDALQAYNHDHWRLINLHTQFMQALKGNEGNVKGWLEACLKMMKEMPLPELSSELLQAFLRGYSLQFKQNSPEDMVTLANFVDENDTMFPISHTLDVRKLFELQLTDDPLNPEMVAKLDFFTMSFIQVLTDIEYYKMKASIYRRHPNEMDEVNAFFLLLETSKVKQAIAAHPDLDALFRALYDESNGHFAAHSNPVTWSFLCESPMYLNLASNLARRRMIEW